MKVASHHAALGEANGQSGEQSAALPVTRPLTLLIASLVVVF